MPTQAQRPRVIQRAPRAPKEWSHEFANQLNRWHDAIQNDAQEISYLRGNGLFLPPPFPDTGYGLRVGEVFANDGILTIVRDGEVWVGSFPITVSLGSVMVT